MSEGEKDFLQQLAGLTDESFKIDSRGKGIKSNSPMISYGTAGQNLRDRVPVRSFSLLQEMLGIMNYILYVYTRVHAV